MWPGLVNGGVGFSGTSEGEWRFHTRKDGVCWFSECDEAQSNRGIIRTRSGGRLDGCKGSKSIDSRAVAKKGTRLSH